MTGVQTCALPIYSGNGHDNAGLLDIASKKIRWITQDRWEISGEAFSPDGKFLAYTANLDGNIDIYLYDLATGKARALPLPKGVNYSAGGASPFTRDNSRLLYYHTGPTAPGDLWVYDIPDESAKIKGTRAGALAPHELGSFSKWQND